MRVIRIILLTLTLGALLQGWGFQTHHRINRTAAQSINGPFGEFLFAYQDSLAAHAPDPDLWRKKDSSEGYRHYMDADYYSAYPFDDIPRDYEDALKKYSADSLRSWGIAPWHIIYLCDSLTNLFQQNQWEESIILMAAIGHYIADTHMPLHTVANYNGQNTGNKGVHFRWESQLVNNYIEIIEPDQPVGGLSVPSNEVFNIIIESFSSHATILDADSYARENLSESEKDTLESYDDGEFLKLYLPKLYEKSGELAQERLNKAARRVASFWLTSWIRAGKPVPPRHP
ncbi:MAG: hypothetical protein HQ509_12685 [Candidatus Marinimicrobia bacterium]|nr:hypothetical protein [Candidatus Neomarinimicrobiota bacterium]